MALLKRLRGNKDKASTGGAAQMKMLRRIPQMLRFIPGTAQDVRAYFMTMQYWFGGSDENMLNMVRFVVDRYADGPRRSLRGRVKVPAPVEYPEVGLYHPRLEGRFCEESSVLPGPAGRRLQLRDNLHGLRQHHTTAQQHAQHGPQIVDIETAQQGAAHACSTEAGAQRELGTLVIAVHIQRQQPVAARWRDKGGVATGGYSTPCISAGEQGRTQRIVCIDDSQAQLWPFKQACLGRSIGLHRAVVIQVITTQVGEHRGIKGHRINT
jgi:hypothetical protein